MAITVDEQKEERVPPERIALVCVTKDSGMYTPYWGLERDFHMSPKDCNTGEPDQPGLVYYIRDEGFPWVDFLAWTAVSSAIGVIIGIMGTVLVLKGVL